MLIDEAYYEFCGVTALALDRRVSESVRQPHIFEGLRHGRHAPGLPVLAARQHRKSCTRAQSPYSVNSLAALAAQAAVQDTAYIRRYVAEVLAARELLYVGLEKLGIPYYDSTAISC